ncbi:MAG: preprotein translocase subunit SecG [Chloroflexota bacterium]|nr:preprotein translocase subunit SecG [Chloroflexota bacterium]
METAIYLALIVISIAVIVAVMLQGKGSGLGGGIFGRDAVYSSRRGVEKTLYNITIGLMIAFIVLDLIAVLITG